MEKGTTKMLKVRLFYIIYKENIFSGCTVLPIIQQQPSVCSHVCQKAQAQTTATTTMLPIVASTAIHSQMVSLDTFPSSSASEGREYPALRLEEDVCKDVLPLYGESMKAPLTAGKCCRETRGRKSELNLSRFRSNSLLLCNIQIRSVLIIFPCCNWALCHCLLLPSNTRNTKYEYIWPLSNLTIKPINSTFLETDWCFSTLIELTVTDALQPLYFCLITIWNASWTHTKLCYMTNLFQFYRTFFCALNAAFSCKIRCKNHKIEMDTNPSYLMATIDALLYRIVFGTRVWRNFSLLYQT